MTHIDDPTQTEVQFVKGVGPKRAEVLRIVGVETVADLLYYFPRRYLDRSELSRISDLQVGQEVTVVGRVLTHGLLRARKTFYEVLIADESGNLPLVWFGGIKYLKDRFKPGMVLSASGKVTDFRGVQMVHPEFEIIFADAEEARLHTGRIIPLYPSTAELKRLYLDSRGLRRIISAALGKYVDQLVDPIPIEVAKEHKLPELSAAVRQMHYPDSFAEQQAARQSLALRELIMFQVMVLERRDRDRRRAKPHKIAPPDRDYAALCESLPFALTKAQRKATAELLDDLQRSEPMRRLLQGDVGSGKTVVAALAMAQVARSGYQSALMAPTEILTQQHFETLQSLLKPGGLRLALLTGSTAAAQRRELTKALSAGQIDLIVGTHALISEDVKFKDLALIIIDEQHRFGVKQRETLLAKGKRPDLLVMTATPIPRTLALTAYGDLELSLIDELPPGREPVRTALRNDVERPKVYSFIKEQVEQGHRAFIIYPLVEESLKLQLRDATNAFYDLRDQIFPDLEIGLVHGQMPAAERDATMRRFAGGEIGILVATTVVEVGIDIPAATVMLIEHAERFGLGQLHQLRGRVGRADQKSYCVLMTEMEPETESYQRLEQFVQCRDGFAISELDLKLRGPGDLLGVRQAGMPAFRVADLVTDLNLILTARESARKLLDNRYRLSSEEKARLKNFVRRQRQASWFAAAS
jgi:ATP-dependent DNA helicase RecG